MLPLRTIFDTLFREISICYLSRPTADTTAYRLLKSAISPVRRCRQRILLRDVLLYYSCTRFIEAFTAPNFIYRAFELECARVYTERIAEVIFRH